LHEIVYYSSKIYRTRQGTINLKIILCEPEIPQNAGNIARTCALTDTGLHLIKPLGFSLEDKYMKRAGLDYWDKVKVQIWDNLEECVNSLSGSAFYYATTKAGRLYTEASYPDASVLVFGSESKGLSEKVLQENQDKLIRIPMIDFGRSLNLSNAVAVVLYEALRQKGFKNLQ
jgi:tRNA (cytidine/uridine-2'-O-)-methyltransferase